MPSAVPFTNLHCHTIFSDGKNTPEEMVLAAIDSGMATIGFSDHSYTQEDLLYCIRPSALPAYKREVRRLKDKYAGQIEIALGLEVDSMTVLTDRADYDYILGDVHYVIKDGVMWHVDNSAREMRQCIDQAFGGDTLAYAKAYFDRYVDGMQRMKPDILGHFDLITKFGFMDEAAPAYRALALDALHASLAVTPLVEMNTGAISRGYRTLPYPADFLLHAIRDAKGEIILSSDSHAVDTQTCFFNESLDILRAAGYDHVTVWQGGGFRQVGI